MRILILVILCIHCHYGESFGSMFKSAMSGISDMTYCRFKECCNDDYIPADFNLLRKLLKDNLHGQHIAKEVVIYALRSHVNEKRPKKALTMTFHGQPGTGKNYVSNFIVEALYKKGENSKYVHNFKGRLHFRSDGLVKQYQEELWKNLTRSLHECPRSIFIFDEIEKIPAKILDILVPFLDYDPHMRDFNGDRVDPTRAIFIFLTNTGGALIAKEMFKMWELGKLREEIELVDFEKQLELILFNERGGLYKSDTIESSLIDHYVPFLPLEREHVIKCAIDAFKRRGVDPDRHQIEKIMKGLSFGPQPHNLYSEGGCKRLDQKVGSIIQSKYFSDL